MDIKNVGGTPGGTRTFLLGLIMLVVGSYLLFNQGSGTSFGITLIPLLFGIGILFANGKSLVGRGLTGLGFLAILVGIIVNLDIHFRQTSLWNTLTMLILIVGGMGLIVRSVMPMPPRELPTPPGA